jgi:hypothetical protein
MTVIEAIQLAQALGLGSLGLGLMKWGLTVERRLLKIEVKTRIQ